MPKQAMIGDVPGNVLGMLGDLMLKLRDGSRTPEQLDRFNKGQNPFVEPSDLVGKWVEFYRRFCAMECDLSRVRIPERKPDFDRLIIVAQGLTPNIVYNTCARQFPCWRYNDDLDGVVVRNERTPKNDSYAIWVRDRVEADDELKNLSALDIEQRSITAETLLERELHELKFWSETGQHLDIENITLCSGSRDSRGGVPSADGDGGGFYVDWYDPQHAGGHLRSRAVVS